MAGPLDGLLVVELGAAISGPYAATVLGDLGADVVKIERRGGGVQRTFPFDHDKEGHPSLTWRFLTLNRSKQSLSVDLKTDEGREIVQELGAEADVWIENMRSGVAERLGVGWDELRTENPELVYCSISGYGDEGPYADLPALDTTVQGVSAFASQVGELDRPEAMNIFVVDMATAIYAALGITTALLERSASGEGQRIDVSMLDAAVSFLPVQLSAYSAGQSNPDYEPHYGQPFAPDGHFETADGYLSMMIGPARWEAFCEAIDRPAWTSDHEYATGDGRFDNRESLREDIEAALAEKTTEEWLAHFGDLDASLPVAPANDVESLVEDPQVAANGSIVEREHHVFGTQYTPDIVPTFSRTPGEITDAPELGEHTGPILSVLGYSDAEIESLRDDGVVE